MRALAFLSSALMTFSLAAQQEVSGERAGVSAPPGSAARVEPSVVADRIVERTNDFRAEHSTPAVAISAELRQASRYFADYMARSDTYSHTADGNQPFERAEAHGYELCIVTENIAYAYREQGFPDEDALAAELVQGWIDSPSHRRNMADVDVTETGVGVARSEHSGRYYGVQMFGRPQAEAIEFSIANDWSRNVDYTLDGRTYALQPGQVRQHRVCRPPELELPFPRRQQRPERTVRPQAGDRFVIVDRSGGREPDVIRR